MEQCRKVLRAMTAPWNENWNATESLRLSDKLQIFIDAIEKNHNGNLVVKEDQALFLLLRVLNESKEELLDLEGAENANP